MEMRNAVNIEIKNAIVHVLDKGADEPIYNQIQLELTGPILEYIGGHLIKLTADDAAIKGKMFNDFGMVFTRSKGVITDEMNFVTSSQEIAGFIFKVIKQYDAVPSCDLIIVDFTIDDVPVVGILKMDYEKSVEHDIQFEDEQFNISLSFIERSLPMPNRKISCGAIIKMPGADDGYDLIAIERIVKGLDGEPVEFFLKEVIQANRVVDHVDKTRMFYKQTEEWLRKNIRNEMDKAIGLREELRRIYENDVEINLGEVAEELIDDEMKREKFIEYFEVRGIEADVPFEMDVKFIEKKMKNRTIKTDTGFTIKSTLDMMDDPTKFEIKYNGDGTVNFIIKNVRNISQ